jgi:hypothetical protein
VARGSHLEGSRVDATTENWCMMRSRASLASMAVAARRASCTEMEPTQTGVAFRPCSLVLRSAGPETRRGSAAMRLGLWLEFAQRVPEIQ